MRVGSGMRRKTPEISVRKHVNCFPPGKRKSLTNGRNTRWNLSIGPLVTVLALVAGAATAASAAPISRHGVGPCQTQALSENDLSC
jgi:hypothetical protein